MRASRLLHMLVLLQNRGKMTSAELAEELEVSRRTILRDLDALSEAGLPVLAHVGSRGGIELGFEYRTRLTGLSQDESEALALLLTRPAPELAAIGLDRSAARARSKMLESFPDRVRARMKRATEQFRFAASEAGPSVDVRVPALAKAVRGCSVVVLRCRSKRPLPIHPTSLVHGATGWSVHDAQSDADIPLSEWGHVNISSKAFAEPDAR